MCKNESYTHLSHSAGVIVVFAEHSFANRVWSERLSPARPRTRAAPFITGMIKVLLATRTRIAARLPEVKKVFAPCAEIGQNLHVVFGLFRNGAAAHSKII